MKTSSTVLPGLSSSVSRSTLGALPSATRAYGRIGVVNSDQRGTGESPAETRYTLLGDIVRMDGIFQCAIDPIMCLCACALRVRRNVSSICARHKKAIPPTLASAPEPAGPEPPASPRAAGIAVHACRHRSDVGSRSRCGEDEVGYL